jgi:cytochrome c peroxidase
MIPRSFVRPLVLGAGFCALAVAGRATQDAPPIIPSGSTPGTLSIDEIRAALAALDAHTPFVPASPVGLPPGLSDFIPESDPLTKAKVELGKQLYFDPRLSADNTVACASCHHPDFGWADGRPVSTGIHGQLGGRSAPTVMNRLLGKSQFWDGRAATLEEQAAGPVENSVEMGFKWKDAAEVVNGIEGYKLQFDAVFGKPATDELITRAIAAFERTVLAGDSPYDHYERATPWHRFDADDETDPELLARYAEAMQGEEDHPMTDLAIEGRDLFFGKANCSSCHVGWDLSDEDFHNIGIGMGVEEPDLGRFDFTGDEADKGKFKTPPLHNIADTAPYMHDGSLATLRDVVEHYNQGGFPNPTLSDKIFPLELTDHEVDALVEFMEQGLQGRVTPVEPPKLP